MRGLKSLWDHPALRHRLQVGGYARIHNNISQTARRFNHIESVITRTATRGLSEPVTFPSSSTARGG